MKKIENEFLSVSINACGATLSSVFDKKNNRELLWQGDSKSWDKQDIVIFPFVGRMKDGFYTVNGEKYTMPIHGLCAEHEFKVLQHTADSILLDFKWNEETFKSYPFKFDLKVLRELVGNKLKTTFCVKNLGKNEMYYGLGAHPAFNLTAVESAKKTDTSGNFIDFGEEISPNNYGLAGGCFLTPTAPFGTFAKLEITKELMEKNKTILLAGEADLEKKTRSLPQSIKLVRGDGVEIKFNIGRPPILAFWSHEKFGAYVAIEPWYGSPDFDEVEREISKKPLLNSLKADRVFKYTFEIEI